MTESETIEAVTAKLQGATFHRLARPIQTYVGCQVTIDIPHHDARSGLIGHLVSVFNFARAGTVIGVMVNERELEILSLVYAE